MKKFYELLKPGLFPFSICVFLFAFSILYNAFGLPSPEELTSLITKWFKEYGLELLFIAAFIEGLFVIGMYFPGSLAIALAVYTMGENILDLFLIGAISFISFLLANIANYYLGKYGYYKLLILLGNRNAVDKMHDTFIKHGSRTFLLTGFFPNFIAIASVCAGISKLKFVKVLSNLSTSLLFWVTIWTIAGSIIVKKINLQDSNQSYYLIGIFFGWGIISIVREKYKKEKSPE